MDRATCGSRCTFLYFWRVLVWLNSTCSPSQSNQTGFDCGAPSGPTVATCARAFDFNRSVYFDGIIQSSPYSFNSPVRQMPGGCQLPVICTDHSKVMSLAVSFRASLSHNPGSVL